MTTRYRVEYALKTHRRDQLVRHLITPGLNLAKSWLIDRVDQGTSRGSIRVAFAAYSSLGWKWRIFCRCG